MFPTIHTGAPSCVLHGALSRVARHLTDVVAFSFRVLVFDRKLQGASELNT